MNSRALAIYNSKQEEIRRRWPALFKPLVSPPTIDKTALVIGRDSKGQPVLLPLRVRRQHGLCIGGTDTGKSKFNFVYLVQAIMHGEGVLFLDPHGSHPNSEARELLAWLHRTGYAEGRRITYFDFSGKNTIVGFNPLHRPADTAVSVVVSKVMKAASIVWNEEDTSNRPTLERVFSVCLYALIELNLTLAELPILLDYEDRWGLRRHALREIKDRYVTTELERVHKLSTDGRRVRDYDNDVIGPVNRLRRVLFSEAIRTSLGQTGQTFDARAAMDNGEIIIADVSETNLVSEEDASLFARLLIREFLFHAKRRSNLRPFNLVIDEASRLFSSDLPVALAALRKYGVSIMASLQWLGQAEDYDESILKALLNGCGTKIVFRLPDAEDSELLANSIVPLNLELPVEILVKPTIVGHKITRLANESQGINQSDTIGHSVAEGETWGRATTRAETLAHTEGVAVGESEMESSSTMDAISDGVMSAASSSSMSGSSSAALSGDATSVGQTVWVGGVVLPDPVSSKESHGSAHHDGTAQGTSSASSNGSSSGTTRNSSHGSGHSHGKSHSVVHSSADTHAITHAETESYAKSIVHTASEARTKGTSSSKGWGETFEPIMKDLPNAVHSKENVLYMAAQRLRTLRTGVAFLSFMDNSGPFAGLVNITPILTPPLVDFEQIREQVMVTSNGAVPIDTALQAIETRHQHLQQMLLPTVPPLKEKKPEQRRKPRKPW